MKTFWRLTLGMLAAGVIIGGVGSCAHPDAKPFALVILAGCMLAMFAICAAWYYLDLD